MLSWLVFEVLARLCDYANVNSMVVGVVNRNPLTFWRDVKTFYLLENSRR